MAFNEKNMLEKALIKKKKKTGSYICNNLGSLSRTKFSTDHTIKYNSNGRWAPTKLSHFLCVELEILPKQNC